MKRPITAVGPAGGYLLGLAMFRSAAQLAARDIQTWAIHDGEQVEISVDDVCRLVEPNEATRQLA